MSHQGAPGLPLGRPSGGVGELWPTQEHSLKPPTLRGKEGFVLTPDCRNTQSACHSCFFLCKLKTFAWLPISNSTGSVICFEVCAPGPERVTHNPCFVVVTEGWGEGNCQTERAPQAHS